MADNYFETIGSGSRSGDTITRIYNATKSYARELFDSYTQPGVRRRIFQQIFVVCQHRGNACRRNVGISGRPCR